MENNQTEAIERMINEFASQYTPYLGFDKIKQIEVFEKKKYKKNNKTKNILKKKVKDMEEIIVTIIKRLDQLTNFTGNVFNFFSHKFLFKPFFLPHLFG